ncbi:hypothetical protein, partial [Streptomyces wedmorensis]
GVAGLYNAGGRQLFDHAAAWENQLADHINQLGGTAHGDMVGQILGTSIGTRLAKSDTTGPQTATIDFALGAGDQDGTPTAIDTDPTQDNDGEPWAVDNEPSTLTAQIVHCDSNNTNCTPEGNPVNINSLVRPYLNHQHDYAKSTVNGVTTYTSDWVLITDAYGYKMMFRVSITHDPKHGYRGNMEIKNSRSYTEGIAVRIAIGDKGGKGFSYTDAPYYGLTSGKPAGVVLGGDATLIAHTSWTWARPYQVNGTFFPNVHGEGRGFQFGQGENGKMGLTSVKENLSQWKR